MPVASIIISNDELGDGDILQLNSANFLLRVALIFLIVIVIIFVAMQLIKLICQIWTIISKAAEQLSIAYAQVGLSFDSETPETTVHSKNRKSWKKSKRRKSKYSLPSKEMKIQLSLKNEEEREIISDSEIISKNKPQNEIQNIAEINVVPHGEIQKFSNLQNLPPATSISAIEKPMSPKINAQDSLMVINNQMSLRPLDNVEQRNSAAQSKKQEPNFLPAKLQDSLMLINNHMPLQPAGNVEQSNSGIK